MKNTLNFDYRPTEKCGSRGSANNGRASGAATNLKLVKKVRCTFCGGLVDRITGK